MTDSHDPTGPTHATPTPAPQLAPPAPVLEAPAPEAPAPVAIGSMRVGHAEDRAESDADAMADRALSRLVPLDPSGHQHGPGCDHIRRMPAPNAVVGHEGGDLDADTTARIESMRGGGRPMAEGVLRRMESAFGRSFSGVRIHDDTTSAQLNRAVSARAFTTGQDVFFGAGEYDPGSPAGERVLAHELAHTLQNASGAHRTLDAGATRAAAGRSVPVTSAEQVEQVEQPVPVPLPLSAPTVERSDGVVRRRHRNRGSRSPRPAPGLRWEVEWDESLDEEAAVTAQRAGQEVEGEQFEDEDHYDQEHGFDDLTGAPDWDDDFDEEAAVAALPRERRSEDSPDSSAEPEVEYEDEDHYERDQGFDDLTGAPDWDDDFDEEAAVAALDETGADLAELDAVSLTAPRPDLPAGAPRAAEHLLTHRDAVATAHDTLTPSAPASTVASVMTDMAGPADAMLTDLNDLVVAQEVDADNILTSAAFGVLDAAAAQLTSPDDPSDLTPDDADRLLRAATWLAQQVAASFDTP